MTDIIKEPALNFNGFYDQARQKLQAAQDLGKKGWDTCPVLNLQKGAIKAIEEGHWVDLANYALFMWARGEYGFPIAGKEANESLRDALRLANITIEQQHQSIADLKNKGSQTPESRLNDVVLEQNIAELVTTELSAYLTCNRVGDANVVSLEYKDVPLESVATITASIEKLAAILSNQSVEPAASSSNYDAKVGM